MDIKRIHEMLEKLTECAKSEFDKGIDQVDVAEMGAVIDMIKDLACAEKDRKITKAMDKADEDELKEQEYLLRTLKEQYGEDDGKRYYDNYRYANGRFAPKGRGTRRGYEQIMPVDLEYLRDMDRDLNRMYYSGSASQSGGQSANTSGNSSMGYSENIRNYGGNSRGYNSRYYSGRTNESRSERARRGYTETKELHNSNSAEDKEEKMASLEEYMKELSSDLTDLFKDMTPEEQKLAKNKINMLANKL